MIVNAAITDRQRTIKKVCFLFIGLSVFSRQELIKTKKVLEHSGAISKASSHRKQQTAARRWFAFNAL
jgi:hypothetical protein